MKKQIVPDKLPGIIFISFILIIGIFIYKDYGVSWDERDQREIGYKSYDYVIKGDKSLYDFINNDYGVAFELPLIFIEEIFKLKNDRNIYLTRHLVTHLFFVFSLWFLYLNSRLLFKNNLIAILVVAMVALHPRLYSHSFFNSKDIPFLAMFIIVFYLTTKAFINQKSGKFISLGIGCGLLVNIRIMGILIVAIITILLILDLLLNIKNKAQIKNNLFHLISFIFSFIAALVATWPYLWIKPAKNFIIAFNNMSNFRWKRTVLFLGEQIKSTELPWNYFPAWFGLTTPILFLISGIAGIVLFILTFFKRPLNFIKNTPDRNFLIYFLCLLGPITAVIIFNSVLYDGWRQMFFVYPAFALLAGFAINYFIVKYQKIKYSLIFIFGGYLIYIIVNIISIHPYQNVYFNELIPGKRGFIREYMEMDYWGVTYKQALDYIRQNDSRENIKINFSNYPGILNLRILPEEDKSRMHDVSDIEEADYFVSNYRWHPQEYEFEDAREAYEIRYKNSEIIKVWKFDRN